MYIPFVLIIFSLWLKNETFHNFDYGMYLVSKTIPYCSLYIAIEIVFKEN